MTEFRRTVHEAGKEIRSTVTTPDATKAAKEHYQVAIDADAVAETITEYERNEIRNEPTY